MSQNNAPVIRNETGLTDCPECGRSFETEFRLRMHWGSVHDGPAPWWPEKERVERFGVWWKHQRERCLERDNHRCQNCGATEDAQYTDEVQVHHTVPYNAFDPDEFPHRLDNLVTLCIPCHRLLETLPAGQQREVLAAETVFHPAALTN
jgi:ribosomal protein S27AE